MLNISRTLLLILSCIILSSCQHKLKKQKEEEIAETAYQKGVSSLELHNYKKAVSYLTQVYFLDPSSLVAQKAQLLEMYSSFMLKHYDESIEVAENFLRFYPLNKNADYASYINALSHYVQISPLYLDQSFTQKTKNLFEEFIQNYPNSNFIKFAKEKLLVINEHLAGKEMEIGRYYIFLNDPITALIRFKTVLNDYDKTNQVPECLYRLSASFMMLGMKDEAVKYAALLGYNFPDSKWYSYNYKLIKDQEERSSEKKKIIPN